MAQTPGQQRATDAVADELAERGWTNTDLRDATGDLEGDDPPVDLGTIGDFLSYRRWPKTGTLAKFERVFGWPVGSLRKLSLSGTPIPKPESQGSVTPTQDDEASQWLNREMSDLTDDERDELWRTALPVLEALKAATLSRRKPGSTLGDT